MRIAFISEHASPLAMLGGITWQPVGRTAS